MAKKIFKYFPIVTLVLTMVAAPVLACVCAETAENSHSCCPEQRQSKDASHQAQEKEPCCEFRGMVERSAEVVVASPEVTVLIQVFASAPAQVTPQITAFIPQEFSYPGVHAPPDLYLKNHSLLL